MSYENMNTQKFKELSEVEDHIVLDEGIKVRNETFGGYMLRISVCIILTFLTTANPVFGQNKKKQKKIDKVIATGKSYIGTPYKYGGTSKSGIDCSGLIQNSYRSVGIKLPRTAKEQSKVGAKKGWDHLRPGDIVYFKFKEKRNKWYHSGMITRVGDNTIKFIHASSSRGVVESELYNDYYKKNVKTFRRVIK